MPYPLDLNWTAWAVTARDREPENLLACIGGGLRRVGRLARVGCEETPRLVVVPAWDQCLESRTDAWLLPVRWCCWLASPLSRQAG